MGDIFDPERPRIDDPFYLENNNPIRHGTDPDDGLPRPIPMNSIEDSKSPRLVPDRFICMGAEGRPACTHYVRQLYPWPSDPDRHVCQRYCTALKNEDGEYVSLNDQEVLACSLRSPRDPDSEKLLDEHDEKILKMQKASQEEPEEEFDPLAEMKNGG